MSMLVIVMVQLLSKTEVSVVYDNTKSSLYKASDLCKASHGYNNYDDDDD